MEASFWASILVVAYVYAGYPLLLACWSAVSGRPVRQRPANSPDYPTVTAIVAARTESPRLCYRVANLLEQVYPHRIEIIVVSDGSTDGAREALAPFGDRVHLLELPRGGKPQALNAGVAAAQGEVIVF